MYGFRMWHPQDLPWLDRVAAAAAWESLSADERGSAQPGLIAQTAQQQLREVLGSGSGLGIIACAGYQPVGFVLGALGPDTTTDEVHGLIIYVWTAPEHRRRGLGRQMSELAEQHFAVTGARKVKIWTGLHNQPAVAMAKAAGYEPEGLLGMKDL
jgi:ribosomal protein S18 acetylase RimI-like enzyme